jgi:hypothetical protein
MRIRTQNTGDRIQEKKLEVNKDCEIPSITLCLCAYVPLHLKKPSSFVIVFEKTKPISGCQNERKVSYKKGVREGCRFWKPEKQSQSKPISRPSAGSPKTLHKESSGRISKSETEAFDGGRFEKTKPICREPK